MPSSPLVCPLDPSKGEVVPEKVSWDQALEVVAWDGILVQGSSFTQASSYLQPQFLHL